MKTYSGHSCLDDLELLAELGVWKDTFEYLDAYEQIHRSCRGCTPRRSEVTV